MVAQIIRSHGRPIGSAVRQNIIEILYTYGPLHGYEIYKIYCEIFPEVTLRLIYYHLKKGVSLGEFQIEKVLSKEGDYSWGKSTENIIYSLGTHAKPKVNERIREHKEKRSRL